MSDKSKSPPALAKKTTKPIIKIQVSNEKIQTKNYQPSRFVVAERLQPITYKTQEVLSEFQTKIESTILNPNLLKSVQPSQQRVIQPKEYKKKPLRRQENEMQMYKDIFVQPKADALQELKEKEKDFEALFHKGQAKQYDKILNIKEVEEKQTKTLLGSLLNEQIMKSTAPMDNIDLKKEIDKVAQMDLAVQPETNFQFFDQQISVQPPDLPNASIASPLTPGNGYAPSIPYTHNVKENNRTSIKDLLVRAKAGMQAGDIQKEAHLSFYLGMVYESSKNHNEAVRFYKKFVACAKLMEDKIGMALGTNRVAFNYYNAGNYTKSIEFHKQNLQYSDQENMFTEGQEITRIQWNILNKLWSTGAQKRDEAESQCISFGQLGIVYLEIKQYQLAYENFQNCYELARRLKNHKLQLECLLNLIKISGYLQTPVEIQTDILRNAIQCANHLNEKSIATLCLCNLGVLESKPQQPIEEYDDLEYEQF
ncbi:unnamed protein product (macronuclear) [Paramecium tetraurelia]|uniref:MalT-like TPR region domain-containing protein n=1 Tax=Paramecium tetraurelia TaxID=5888 RepID=A0DPL1_PARTE|nr:uncharacterized protein GSPATT00019160001 [Paramecium tetraurelia]CAK84978.1 unnamed protein product [Paramecium tetraurelia]|eukprot:XP_001452375.1 hypothetical protein (macronuclear) [Paramecium tetraurelia strain d4-2]